MTGRRPVFCPSTAFFNGPPGTSQVAAKVPFIDSVRVAAVRGSVTDRIEDHEFAAVT